MAYNSVSMGRDSGYTTTDGLSSTTWAGSNYVPVLYAKKLLEKFYKQTVFTEITN